jgi:hypothetical protein
LDIYYFIVLFSNWIDVTLQAMRYVLVLFFFLISFSIIAQDSSLVPEKKMMRYRDFPRDTIWPKNSNDYYDNYSNQLGLFLSGKYKTTNVLIKDHLTGKQLDYSPKNQLYLGPGFTYKIIGNGLSASFGFLNGDQGSEPTKRTDLYVNIILKRFIFDFSYRYYKNFTLKNSSDYNLGDQPYVRPDIQTVHLGMGMVYVLSYKKFSYRAAFTQTAIQKKSAGSFMFGTQISLQALQGDSSIFPQSAGLPEVTGRGSLYMGLTTAYAYNFIIKKHYFIALSLATAIEFGKVVTMLNHAEKYTNHTPSMHFQPRVVAGINKPKWYLGMSIVGDYFMQTFVPDDTRFEFRIRSGNIRFFVGRRFNWLSRKQLDKKL